LLRDRHRKAFAAMDRNNNEMLRRDNVLKPGGWWLMPVILATQEAEIRRIQVQSQPEKIVCKALS
jgi:uncharacterized membrane protein YqiK